MLKYTLVYSWFALETRETATKWLTSLYNRELDLTSWRVVPLRINTNKLDEFTSAFDRQADKYGYEIFSPKPKLKDEWINHIAGDTQIWKNKHWDYVECEEMLIEWSNKFHQNDKNFQTTLGDI